MRRRSGRESSTYARPGSVKSRGGSVRSQTLMSLQHKKIVEQQEAEEGEALSQQTTDSVIDDSAAGEEVDGGDEVDGVSKLNISLRGKWVKHYMLERDKKM